MKQAAGGVSPKRLVTGIIKTKHDDSRDPNAAWRGLSGSPDGGRRRGRNRAVDATVARVSALEGELEDTRARLSEVECRLEELEDGTRRSSVIIQRDS